jgi:hypothetical protein
MPEPITVFGRFRAQAAQLRVWPITTRDQNQLHPLCRQFHQPLDAVTPVADAAVQGNQDDFGVAQHLVDVQIHRCMILHLHRIGQAQARVVTRQLLRGFSQQGQIRVGAAQDHQLGGGLAQVSDAVVRNEAAGLSAQQVHG